MNNSLKEIVLWIRNRCLLRHNEHPSSKTIESLDKIFEYISNTEECGIDTAVLDKIIAKYYFDFYMDKSTNLDGFAIGFSDTDRHVLRNNILNIYRDISDYLIKQDNSYKKIKDNMLPDIFDDDEKIQYTISNNV